MTSDFAVSVVIPLFNKQTFIRRTLQSALNQSLTAREIIIIDDSSTDGSTAAIEDLVGGRVRLIRQANAGPGPARNRGIAEATGEWIAFLDADDLWRPEHLATLAEVAAEFPDAAVVASGHRRFRGDNDILATNLAPAAARRVEFFREAQRGEALHTSAVAVRRSALDAATGFGAFCPGEDLDLWIRLALVHFIAQSDRATVGYRQDTGGVMDALNGARSLDPRPQAMFATLAAALAAASDSDQGRDIRGLRDGLLINSVKQELYRGNTRAARALISDCKRLGAAVPHTYRLLALIPGQLGAAAIRLTVRLR